MSALGKKLAEHSLSLPVLPDLLLLATLAAAHTLGHERPFEVTCLGDRINSWTTDPAIGRAGTVALLVGGMVLAAAGIGMLPQALGSFTERVWLAGNCPAWPGPLRHLARGASTDAPAAGA